MEGSWTKTIPTLIGKTAVVTGGNGGIGYEVSLGLAEVGATVVIAARNETKANLAICKIKSMYPWAIISFIHLDLTSLTSVKNFTEAFNNHYKSLDILVNNAAVMLPPKRTVTEDGFELQFATNYLSHFALTSALLPALRKSFDSRVVNVAAMGAKHGRINFDDLQYEKTRIGWETYTQTKLANLLFTFEFQRKSEERSWGVKAIAAHPGACQTDIAVNGPGVNSFLGVMSRLFGKFLLPKAAAGASSILYAAISEDAKPGGYYGPQGLLEYRGEVGPASVPASALDMQTAKKLWDVSVELSGVTWLQ